MTEIIHKAIDKIDSEAEKANNTYLRLFASHIIDNYLNSEENANKVLDEKKSLKDCFKSIKAKARKIMLDYDDKGQAIGITFAIEANGQMLGFQINADVDGVMAVFKRQNIKADREQAERTAWRNVRDWILAQMTFVECGNARIEEVFLPYLTDGKNTLYQAYQSGQLLLPEYKECV